MNSVPITIAFVAGLVSFFAPCLFLIIPGFLSYLAGTSLAQTQVKRKEIFVNSVFFCWIFAGFCRDWRDAKHRD